QKTHRTSSLLFLRGLLPHAHRKQMGTRMLVWCVHAHALLVKMSLTASNGRDGQDMPFVENSATSLRANYGVPLASEGMISFAPSCRTNSCICWQFQSSTSLPSAIRMRIRSPEAEHVRQTMLA